jgi:hypothetical protein
MNRIGNAENGFFSFISQAHRITDISVNITGRWANIAWLGAWQSAKDGFIANVRLWECPTALKWQNIL